MNWRLVILALFALPRVTAWAGSFEFVVIGDTRPKFESESFRPFEGLIAKINPLQPAFIINLGDLIYGYGLSTKEKQWDRYDAVVRTIQPPYYQLPGNHDTHSKKARRLYARRFGKFYQSFDYGDCHFVLLDNTEQQRWGYMSPAQLAWLKNDLKQTAAVSVFVFMHFPVWEPDRITPAYHDFWAQTLHPLFKESRVRAVFAGHYHAYGPTREYDGIRYFITGGGGAELRPEYRKSGGEYHFMRVAAKDGSYDVRVVTARGDLTDPEADVMGGLQFASRNVSRIGIRGDLREAKTGITFAVSLHNPGKELMTGEAEWLFDTSAFSVEPARVEVQVQPGLTHTYTFNLKALHDSPNLGSLPQLRFNVVADGVRRRFHREVRLLQQIEAPYRVTAPVLDGQLVEWTKTPALKLGRISPQEAELRACYDAQYLYLALTVPAFDADEVKEMGFSDEVQIGIARRANDTDFTGDFLRLGLDSDLREVRNRTPGRKGEAVLPGARLVCSTPGPFKCYEVAVPLRLLRPSKGGSGSHLILDLSFPVADGGPETSEPAEPAANTFSYRIRYGSDSLVPVHFVELDFGPKR